MSIKILAGQKDYSDFYREKVSEYFSIIGLVGWLLCCTGDVLFDLKGQGNEKLRTSKNIDSNWSKMAEWRFCLSILCVMFVDLNDSLGVPKWMALLNSIVFLIVGVLFRKINPNKFQDLPGIIMPSLGLAMIGVIGIVAYLI